MPNQLESALVIALRDNITWESAVESPESGTLTPVNPSLPFDAATYQERDRQLAYRDLILGAAVVEVSVQVGDVWNYSVAKPSLQGPAPYTLPFVSTEAGTFNSKVRHVTNVSVPYDAARYADADLYGRDALAYEILARACNNAFTDPSIPQIDSNGAYISDTSVWSLAEGQQSRSDINTALPLNRSLFKDPDRNLADRDNQIAGYVARLAQILKNPFSSANRLYVQIAASGTLQREPDTYALITDDGTNRVFQTEPAVTGGNQIVYNVPHKTLQWIGTSVDDVHVPQIYAMSVPGVDYGQTIETLPEVPSVKDPQYWRGKADQLKPVGMQVTDTDSYLDTTLGNSTGGYPQVDSASFPVVGNMQLNFTGSLAARAYRVSALCLPSSDVEIRGDTSTTNTSGTLGGATFAVDVSSGAISNNIYLVEGGSGIVYRGNHVLPGDVFTGTTAFTTYTQYGAQPSTVRQYALNYELALPAGAWELTVDYTNISGTSTGFAIRVDYTASSSDPVTVIQDTTLQPFSGVNGTVLTTPVAGVDIINATPFTLPLYWTSGDGQLHIRKLTFTSLDATEGRYAIAGTLAGVVAKVDVTGQDKVPDVLRWQFVTSTDVSSSIPVTLNYTEENSLPIRIQKADIQLLSDFTPTPLSTNFQGWRQECLNRAEKAVCQSFSSAVEAYGTDVPSFRSSGSVWNTDGAEDWMSFIEVYCPRLREITVIDDDNLTVGHQYEVDSTPINYNGVTYTGGQRFYATAESGTNYTGGTVHQVGAFKLSRSGHVGRPAIVPRGIYFDDSDKTVKAYYDGKLASPMLAACQPWMIEAGFYVAQEEFWMPEQLGIYAPTT